MKRLSLDNGIFLTRATQASRIKFLLNLLRPVDAGIELIRIGGNSDGGYLVPNDLAGIKACFSPGVFETALFEEELKEKYDIPSHLADYSVDGPPGKFVPKSFLKRFVGSYNSEEYITISDWILKNESLNSKDEFILQMDIEGGEYETIIATPREILLKFRILVLEIHGFNDWGNPTYFGLVSKFFDKLLMDFKVLHVHANNCCGTSRISGVEFPNVFELTLIRNDRISNPSLHYSVLPHNLDFDNVATGDVLQVSDSFAKLDHPRGQ